MLDRLQHLKLFLTGSGDSQEDVELVLSDEFVQDELYRHPIDVWRLLDAVSPGFTIRISGRSVSPFVQSV